MQGCVALGASNGVEKEHIQIHLDRHLYIGSVTETRERAIKSIEGSRA
jgi:hypothetical protein